MARRHLAVLGPTEVRLDGTAVPMRSVLQRRLLAALVLWRRGVSASRLADAVWPDAPPHDPSGALANQIARLRRLLGEDAIESVSGGYRLGGGVACDVDELDAAEAAEVTDAIESLWRGRPYEELDIDEARAEASRLAERMLALRERRADVLLKRGDVDVAVAAAASLVREHPLRERPRIVLAQALAAMGRRAEALRELDDLRRCVAQEVGIDVSSEVDAVQRRLLGDERSTIRRRAIHTAGPLIGRDELLAHLSESLHEHRLVTLTGVGGIGKTAAALAVAEQAGAELIDLVSLARARRDEDVAAAVAAQLAVEPIRGEPLLERVTDVLAFESGIVVLDNAEQVLLGVVELVDALLTRTPVRVLVTSRARLGHPHEHVVPVPALGTDGDQGGPAGKLFATRARTVRADWRSDEPSEVADLCRRLDGLPLAIELAAAQLASRTLGELLDDLDRPLDLLTGDRTGRSGLREVLDRSYGLLDAVHRDVLGQVAVFRSGFTASDATIACASIGDRLEVTRALDRLVTASLLTCHERRYGMRYALLETVREHVLEKPHVDPDVRDARHATAMLHLVEQGLIDAYTADEPVWAERSTDTLADIIAAFEHFTRVGDASSAARVALAAYVIGIPRRHVDLAALPATAAQSGEDGGVEPTLLAESLGLAADAAAYAGDRDLALEFIGRAGRVVAPEHAQRYADAVAADLALYAGDIEGAVDHLKRANAGFEARAQPALAAWMQATIPLARSYGGHADDQVGDALRALADAERTGCPSTIAFARYVVAEVLRRRDSDEALRQLERALDEALTVDAYFVAGLTRLSLATDARVRGQVVRSAALHRVAVTEWERLGNWAQQATTLRGAAVLNGQAARHGAALTILLALEALDVQASWGTDAETVAVTMESARRALSQRDIDAASASAAGVTRSRLVRYTIDTLDELQQSA